MRNGDSGYVQFSKEQIEFLTYYTETKDPMKAVDKFVKIMVEEKADPREILLYLNKIIAKRRNNK